MIGLLGTFHFTECDTCRAKPGTPPLCEGCLWNRQVITRANYLAQAVGDKYGKKVAGRLIEKATVAARPPER